MIRRTSGRMRWCTVLLCLNIVFIWGNSLMPGESSGAISRYFWDLLAELFSIPIQTPSGGHGLLRKLAHLSEFCCLGILLSWLLRMLREKPWQQTVIPTCAGFAVACIDETIQYFVPDRGPGLRDVAIDTLGVSIGVLVMLVIARLLKNKQSTNRRV